MITDLGILQPLALVGAVALAWWGCKLLAFILEMARPASDWKVKVVYEDDPATALVSTCRCPSPNDAIADELDAAETLRRTIISIKVEPDTST